MSQVFRLSLPLTVWLIGFCALYALQGLTCSRHWPPSIDARSALIAAAAVFVLVQAVVLVAVLRAPSASRFLQRATIALAAVALASAAWTSIPVLAVSICR